MHICYLCDEYPPEPHGGVGSFTQNMARLMASRGHEVTVLGVYGSVRRPRQERDGEVTVLRLPHAPIPRTGLVVNGLRLGRALRELHARSPLAIVEGPELAFARVRPPAGPAPVIRMHGGHHFFAVTLGRRPRPWRSWMERRSFRRATALCAVSRYVAEVTGRLLKLGDRHVEILPNFVDTDHFAFAGDPIDDHIVFAGTLCDKKGVHQLLRALPLIHATRPRVRLTVAGRDTRDRDGRSYAEAMRALLPAALLERVEWAGHLDRRELPRLFASARVAVFPSQMESQGLVILEAMATGRAVVTGAVGPGPEVVEDGVSGLLCDPHDPRAIAAAVIRVLTDAELRRQLGRAARSRAVMHFSTAALAGRTERFYEECCRTRVSPDQPAAAAPQVSGG